MESFNPILEVVPVLTSDLFNTSGGLTDDEEEAGRSEVIEEDVTDRK